jgi:hypothetical protein
MKADAVARLYDTLTVDERFRLRLRAFARRDMADCDRLDRTCPRHQFNAYCARVEASDVLTLCTLTELLPKLAKLQMVDAFRPAMEFLEGAGEQAGWMGYLDGYAAGWRAAGGEGDPPHVSDEELTAASERAFRLGSRFSSLSDKVAADLSASTRNPRDALAAFAQDDLGLPLDVLLGAWAPHALAILAEHAEALDAAEPNAYELALSARLLNLAWCRHGLNDPTAEADDELRAALLACEESAE